MLTYVVKTVVLGGKQQGESNMTHININTRRPLSPEDIKARQRLRAAGRDLAAAVAEQREQMAELQGNLNSLDDALDRVTDSMERASAMARESE